MRKLIVFTAVVLAALPLGARADVSTSITERASIGVAHSDGPTYLMGDLWIESTTSLAPALEAGTITETQQTLHGFLMGCDEVEDAHGNLVHRCFGDSFDQPLEPGTVTFDGVPLPGNAVTFSATIEIDGPAGVPILIDFAGSFAKPRHTSVQPCALCTNVNPWMHEGTVHAEVSADSPLIVRNGYQGVVQMTSPGMFSETVSAPASVAYTLSASGAAAAEA